MAQQQGQQQGIGVSVPQVFAGALASVSAAVVASFFGIAGTLIGAAASSIVATIGGAIYKSSIERTQARVVHLRRNPRTGSVTREIVETPASTAPPRRIRWRAVLGGLAAVLALTFGTVTAVEVVAQKPLAAVVQHRPPEAGETTLGAVVEQVADSGPTTPDEPTIPVTGSETPTQSGLTPTSAQTTRTPATKQATSEPTRITPTGVPRQGTPAQP